MYICIYMHICTVHIYMLIYIYIYSNYIYSTYGVQLVPDAMLEHLAASI